MFEKVLIANRGEIAVRIIRTLREMQIKSVAVYSTADQQAQFVQLADEAVCIGGPQPADSYLNMENILSAALLTGAQAIHPGYGFLSESAEFAQLCAECQITFIGPSAALLELMGNKANARQTMSQHQVPIIPGSQGTIQTIAQAQKVAQNIGFPVMLKAAAGGGGKGIRQVNCPEDLPAAFIAAQKEAQLSFGNQQMYLEKVIRPAKHIEIQILADQAHHVIALPERDCSLQRQQQKVLEETPCTLMTAAERTALQKAVITALQAIGYENAGTLEFLMDQKHHFYFMEMNTRIQVEHPITEAVTGLDLIREQIQIAAGQNLTLTQQDVVADGVALEARINAEDPQHNFQPQAGTIQQLDLPGGLGIRLDSGVLAGDRISPFYDSMIIKIIAHAPQRTVALRRLTEALSEFHLQGLKTNHDFLEALLKQPRVCQGTYLTTDIDQKFGPEFQAQAKILKEAINEC